MRRAEVRAGSRANLLYQEADCIAQSFSIEEAKALYKFALRITIDHGEEFHIENGAVGGAAPSAHDSHSRVYRGETGRS